MIETMSNVQLKTDSFSSAGLSKGIHILADMYAVSAGRHEMLNAESLQDFSKAAVKDADLTEVGVSFVQFPDAGVTGVVLLAESHIAIHTWPEKDYITLDVFVCNVSQDNTGKARKLYKAFEGLFQPGHVSYQEVERE